MRPTFAFGQLFTLFFLLVEVCPVVYSVTRKLLVSQCLEWCTRKVQGVAAFNNVEGGVGATSVYTFVSFVYNQKVPV